MSLGAHPASGITTVARAWALARRDGVVMGFTDHDRDLAFEGIVFRADSGLSARALQQSTGLSVDNTEGSGVLSDAGLTEDDILAGRWDGAEVRAWVVNWADVAERELRFRGSVGEVVRKGGAFRADLRGLTEALGTVQGAAFTRGCGAVLGDLRCGFDLAQPGYVAEVAVEAVEDGRVFLWGALPGFDDRWFERGRFSVLTGAAAGLVGVVKNDRASVERRRVELWERLGLPVVPGDLVRIEAGCDKRAETCRLKFGNFLNFRGFPHVPGEDWLTSYPVRGQGNSGGSLQRGGA